MVFVLSDEVSTASVFLLSLWERLGEGLDFVEIATGLIPSRQSSLSKHFPVANAPGFFQSSGSSKNIEQSEARNFSSCYSENIYT